MSGFPKSEESKEFGDERCCVILRFIGDEGGRTGNIHRRRYRNWEIANIKKCKLNNYRIVGLWPLVNQVHNFKNPLRDLNNEYCDTVKCVMT